MTLTRKDVAATALTALAVLTFAAGHEGWNVWLIGGSHRWAAGAMAVLGIAACSLGSPSRGASAWLLGSLGTLALGLTVLALVTGSLTALSLLALDMVVLWAASTLRHTAHIPHRHGPLAT